MRQDMLQPWEMKATLIWEPPADAPTADGGGRARSARRARASVAAGQPRPPADAKVWGPKRGAGWSAVGVTVDEDTVPHILTFTAVSYLRAAAAAAGVPPSGCGNETAREQHHWLDLPPGF